MRAWVNMKLYNELRGYDYLLVSTTARESDKIRRLPDKNLNGYRFASYLITDESSAYDFFKEIDGLINNIFIDVERKKKINLMQVAFACIKTSKISPYKPNDVTVEAADQLILNILGHEVTNKKILVYGTGNIAFKLSLRLLERNIDVVIGGRDNNKITHLMNTLNCIKPKYSTSRASHYKSEGEQFDGLISFVSADKIITPQASKSIIEYGFAIDGGIGNFQEDFIQAALQKHVKLYRLDVRLGNHFLLAAIEAQTSRNDFFESVIGSNISGKVELVAGGIIGGKGTIIVDQIKDPTQIIGVANGYGGVKNDEQLTKNDWKNLQYAKETFL